MRLSMLRAITIAAGAAIALAACSSGGAVPPSSAAYNPTAFNNGNALLPDLTKCDTSPPQYDWVFEGACDKFTLKPGGSPFTLGAYQDISVTGRIGPNKLKASEKVVLVDAVDKSDIKAYGGHAFPKFVYKGHAAFAYAAAINQGSMVVVPKVEPRKAVLEYVITDTKGFSGNTCGAGALASKNGKFVWTPFPGSVFHPDGHKLTVALYTAPAGLVLDPKVPLYVGVVCY